MKNAFIFIYLQATQIVGVIYLCIGLLQWLSGKKKSACNAGDRVQSLGWEDPLEEKMATHSSILALKIPWAEESEGLQSMG